MRFFLMITALALALSCSACAPSAPEAALPESGGEAAASDMGEQLESGEVCSECSSDPYYVKITAEAAKMYIDSSNPTVVDVRAAEEYAGGHIEGAINVPLDEIGDEPPAELQELDAFILVYCRSGVRSEQAAKKLIDLGYLKVYEMGFSRDDAIDYLYSIDNRRRIQGWKDFKVNIYI